MKRLTSKKWWKKLWLDIRDDFLIELEQHLTKRNVFLLVFILVVSIYVLIDDSPTSPPKKNNDDVYISKEEPKKEIPDAQKRKIAKQQAERFIKEYYTYDTRNMDQSKRIQPFVTPSMYEEEKEDEPMIRPTAEIVAVVFKKMDNVYIQPLNDGFLWTATLSTEVTNGKGQKSLQQTSVSVVLQPSVDDPTKWLVSEVISYEGAS